MTLGDIIKQYRQQHGVSMEYVANLCGITKGYVAMLERNINSKTGRPVKPTVETIAKVCNGLHLNIDAVFNQLDDDYEITVASAAPSPLSSSLTDEENHLLSIYRDMDPVAQVKFVAYGEGLVAAGKDYDDMSPAELAADAEREVNRIVADEVAKAGKTKTSAAE